MSAFIQTVSVLPLRFTGSWLVKRESMITAVVPSSAQCGPFDYWADYPVNLGGYMVILLLIYPQLIMYLFCLFSLNHISNHNNELII